MLRRSIVEQVASMMVLPNKWPIKLSDVVEADELKTPEPEVIIPFNRSLTNWVNFCWVTVLLFIVTQ